VGERGLAAAGLLDEAPPIFSHKQSVENGGVLFALPALIAQGLLLYKDVYTEFSKAYYGLQSTILTLAFMALCRIKNPDQLKQHNVGELGALIGLDRVPEVKCLREKIAQIVNQQHASEFNRILFTHWTKDESDFFFYVDGHVRIYSGYKATLAVKYVSRQKLCLTATTEYWVNDAQGLPYLVFMGELTEKMQEVIEYKIIPEIKLNPSVTQPKASAQNPLFTLVFDRECYEPEFFQRLWEKHHIAVITYRKNVKDKWDEIHFKSTANTVFGNNVTGLLYEQEVQLGGHTFREIRKLSEGGHQTAIITTHPIISLAEVASKMFSRWSQENFFKYLIADYDFDKMVQYGTEIIDENTQVVNPPYRKITSEIKSVSEKLQRQKAKFYKLIEQINNEKIDVLPELTRAQMNAKEKINTLQKQLSELKKKRESIPARITLKAMPDATRYDKLKPEGKMIMNIIKMIAYRAETALSEIVRLSLPPKSDEKRMLIKQLFSTPADIIPDEQNNTLTIKISTLSAPRYNQAIENLCTILNETETIFPGTNLKLIYKTGAL